MKSRIINKKFFAFFNILILGISFAFAQPQTETKDTNLEDAQQLRTSIVEVGKKYIGCPYAYGAIGPDEFDCSGYIYAIASEATGYQLPRTVKALYSYVKIIPKAQLEKGDIVFFRTLGNGTISHAGLYIGNDQFMHAVSDGPNTGVIASSLKENTWKNAYAGAGKFLPSADDTDSETTAVAATATVATTSAVAASQANKNKPAAKTTAEKPKETQQKKASPKAKSSKKSVSPFVKKLVFDASLGADWSFFNANKVMLNFRGVPIMTNIRYTGSDLQPGLGVFFRFNTASDVFQLPIVFSVSVTDYFRAYAGPVFTFGGPTLPGDKDEDIKGSVFPGIIGFSWNTPSFTKKDVKVQLIQDVSYTVFNDTDGGALSAKNTFASGLLFTTGIRVTLPFSKIFK